MTIDSISIYNTKSFNNEVCISLKSDFNLLIGPNGGGKSNMLDITTTVLRHFFVTHFHKSIEKTSDGLGIRMYISKEETYENIDKILAKHYDNPNDTVIKISFILSSADILHIETIKKHNQKLSEVANTYQGKEKGYLKNISKWSLTDLEVGKILSYEIRNNQLVRPYENISRPIFTAEETFLSYLNLYELITILSEDLPLKLPPNLIYFAPFRTMDIEDFRVSLANYNIYDEIDSIRAKTSKSSFSLMKIITGYFGEKRRTCERNAKEEGYEALWEQDPEVKLVQRLLAKFGYGWEMNLIDPLQNTYEVCIIEGNIRKNFADTSSGEKEIINFILGILALGIREGIIIIDEAELHLHPKWQITLIDIFKSLTKERNIQFIITTHSASFISEDTLNSVIRIYKGNDKASNVAVFRDTKFPIKKLLHIVTATNNEKMFFSDVVILVEGITDKLVFQKILDERMDNKHIHQSIEILELKGKSNRDMFQTFLGKFSVPYFFIGDLDCVNELGGKEMRDRFKVNKNRILLKEENIEMGVSELSEADKQMFNDFFEKQQAKRNYILQKGTIEDYFPDDFKRKDINIVLDLLDAEKYDIWKSEDIRYKSLENIVDKILEQTT